MSSQIYQALQDNDLLSCPDNLDEMFAAVSPEQAKKEISNRFAPFSLQRAITLLSPAARAELESMARAAHELTLQRFGRTIALYAPLYVSNYCCNQCLYCGFNSTHRIERSRLDIEQAVEEAKIIASEGFGDLLLVSGEDPAYASVDYFCELTRRLRKFFDTISIEIYPLDEESYRKLFEAGVDGMTLYQETYDSKLYPSFHPKGPKADYANRLKAVENCASAGMRQIGIGSLLGLNDWRYEGLCTALHAHTLISKYWRSRISVSFPRMRPASGVSPQWLKPVNDKSLTQLITALRLLFPDIGLVLSTREPADLRDHLLPLGLTRISAGSKTNPGGYGENDSGEEQFQIADERSPKVIAAMLRDKGYDPVWKDWDSSFLSMV